MTHSQYEDQCRDSKTEDHFYTEIETQQRVYYLIKKYDLWGMLESKRWFDYQMEIAHYLGIEYGDLYRRCIDLDNLFHAAYLREKWKREKSG